MELVTTLDEFRRLEAQVPKPGLVFDLVLDDGSLVPAVLAGGDRALGIMVGGHTGFLPFADVPKVADRKVRHTLRVSGVYASLFIGWWLRRRWAAKVGASPARASWIPAI